MLMGVIRWNGAKIASPITICFLKPESYRVKKLSAGKP